MISDSFLNCKRVPNVQEEVLSKQTLPSRIGSAFMSDERTTPEQSWTAECHEGVVRFDLGCSIRDKVSTSSKTKKVCQRVGSLPELLGNR